MANSLYDKGREKFLGPATGQINWSNDDIRVLLVKTSGGYTVDLEADEFVDDIGSGNIIARSAALASKTIAAGVANASSITFTTVSGAACGALVVYKYVGADDAANPLIAYIDTATGLPVTPNGSDIIINWDTGDSKIFKL